jgi:hypothetical protein
MMVKIASEKNILAVGCKGLLNGITQLKALFLI